MSLNISTRYGGRANAPSLDYPTGSFKNKTAPDAVDGTPLEKDWANDLLGARDAILAAAGLTANGTADTAQASQLLAALQSLGLRAATETQAGVLEIATAAEAIALSDNNRVITPAGLDAVLWIFFGGVPLPYPAASASIPTGFLLADGSTLSRTTYSRLFSRIGTTFGPGNGTTTFNLPDLRGEFIRGLDNGRGIDTGRTLGSNQLDALQNISGFADIRRISDGNSIIGNAVTAPFGFAAGGGGINTRLNDTLGADLASDRLSFDASRSARTATETRPRNIAMNYIIKY